jgi:CRISPR-associated protein Cmr4
MYSKVQPFLLYALSSVHAGSGSEIGVVDLPIQRERHTGFPKIESSSLKGAIRATVEELVEAKGDFEMARDVHNIFGNPPTEKLKENLQSGAIALADARTLLFPVKSMRGVFTYVTSPGVIDRFNHEVATYAEMTTDRVESSDFLPIPCELTVSSREPLVGDGKIVLEEYTYPVKVDEKTTALAESLESMLFPNRPGFLKKRLVVLDENSFLDFVKLSTEVNARIRINSKTGTVEGGALFYEENVPPETVFYSFLFIGRLRKENVLDQDKTPEDILELFKNEDYFPSVFQLGGGSTLGRGILKRIWIERGE